MTKKGDISIETVVIAALAVVVLVILIFAFSTNFRNFVKDVVGWGEKTKEANCANFIEQRAWYSVDCDTLTKDTTREGTYITAPYPEGVEKWADAKDSETRHCCKRTG